MLKSNRHYFSNAIKDNTYKCYIIDNINDIDVL